MEGVLIRYPFWIPYEFVALLSQEITVTTIVLNEYEEDFVTSHFLDHSVNLDNCNFLHAPANTSWTRDYGPLYAMTDNQGVIAVDYNYRFPNHTSSDSIPIYLAEYLQLPYYKMPGILFDGTSNFMTDGMGVAASTSYIHTLNPDYTQVQIEELLHDYQGIETYHMLDAPPGGHHLDTWAKFLAPDKIVIREVPPIHPAHQISEAVAAHFGSQLSSYDRPYQVFRVYTPNNEPYTNSLILNNRVFVPITGNPLYDSAALQVYETAMPGYEIHGVGGDWSPGDAVHCRTQEIPDRNMLHIYHKPLARKQFAGEEHLIEARIIPLSGEELQDDSPRLYYRVNGGDYSHGIMNVAEDHWFTAVIPSQETGSEVSYFIQAADLSERSENHPYTGMHEPHRFEVISPLVLQGLSIDDSVYGNGNGIFEAGETVQIVTGFNNEGEQCLHGITAELFSASPYLTIHPPGQALQDSVAADEAIEFGFTVSASLLTPDDYLAFFELLVNTGEGYSSAENFEFVIPSYSMAEYFIEEDFDHWLPDGWELTSTSGHFNWQHSESSYAGGEAPEAQFHWDPPAVAVQRLITPPVNTSDYSRLALEFRQYVSHFEGGYVLSVESSGDGGNTWTELMGFGDGDIPAGSEQVVIENGDVGSEEFRIAWTFNGDSWGINWWNVDDVRLGGVAPLHDIAFLAGQVSFSAGPGSPGDVLISAGGQYASSNEDAHFSLAVPAGVHDVTATACSYLPMTIEEIIFSAGDTIVLDLVLAYIAPPLNLAHETGINTINLFWERDGIRFPGPGGGDGLFVPGSSGGSQSERTGDTYYRVYRSFDQGDFEITGTSFQAGYIDSISEDGLYQYFVSAVYSNAYESESSDTVAASLYRVAFSVAGGQGEVAASVGDTSMSPDDLAGEGKDVIFVATPHPDYRVREWRVNGLVQEGQWDELFVLEHLNESVSVAVVFEEGTGSQVPDPDRISVYPSPAREGFFVESQDRIARLRMIHVGGQLIRDLAPDVYQLWIDISSVPAGLYVLELQSVNDIIIKRIHVIR